MGAGQKDCHLRHHHARAWFEAPLPSAAARNDLNLQLKVLKYRLVAVLNTLQCIRRHYWYLTGPMVALALADRGLEDEEREELARKLYHTPRGQVKSGRPTFPVLEWVGEELARPRLDTLATTCTWLIFHKLQLTGSQVRGRELEWSLYCVPGVAPRVLLRLAPHPRLPAAGGVRQEPAGDQRSR